MGIFGISLGQQTGPEIGFDHINDHRQENFQKTEKVNNRD